MAPQGRRELLARRVPERGAAEVGRQLGVGHEMVRRRREGRDGRGPDRDECHGLCGPVLVDDPDRVPLLAPLDRGMIGSALVVGRALEGVVRDDALDKVVKGSHICERAASLRTALFVVLFVSKSAIVIHFLSLEDPPDLPDPGESHSGLRHVVVLGRPWTVTMGLAYLHPWLNKFF